MDLEILDESFQDNGGPAPTHALGEGSVAIDVVPTSDCGEVDQRFYKRPAGDRCDAGAFERGARPEGEFDFEDGT